MLFKFSVCVMTLTNPQARFWIRVWKTTNGTTKSCFNGKAPNYIQGQTTSVKIFKEFYNHCPKHLLFLACMVVLSFICIVLCSWASWQFHRTQFSCKYDFVLFLWQSIRICHFSLWNRCLSLSQIILLKERYITGRYLGFSIYLFHYSTFHIQNFFKVKMQIIALFLTYFVQKHMVI